MVMDQTLGKPVRALQTFLRQISFRDSDIPRIIPDGVFGATTEESVFAFRTKYGPQPPSGEVDFATWQRILEVYDEMVFVESTPSAVNLYPADHVIRAGSDSKHILPIQAMTAVLAKTYPQLGDGTVSGIHDDASTESVKRLQKLLGLPQSGTVDRTFWEEFVRFYEANAFLEE